MPLFYLVINIMKLVKFFFLLFIFIFIGNSNLSADNHNINEVLDLIRKDLKTLEKAVYSGNIELSNNNLSSENEGYSENTLTRHLLKLSEIEKQFQELTNRFEEINFKIDKISNRLSKTQADNQLRFQDLEFKIQFDNKENNLSIVSKDKKEIELPGTSKPQDLGTTSAYDSQEANIFQETQSIETTNSVLTEQVEREEKILPEGTPEERYKFAKSFLKIGDYSTAEIALREFIDNHNEHELAGSAQYWYAETFRIRQLFTDAASAYLEGYQKYPKSAKAPINLLKLGVSLVQIGEKDQGCSMITGVVKQYPQAKESVLQKAKYEEKKFSCPNKT